MNAPKAPSWISSFGALVALVLAFAAFNKNNGTRDAQIAYTQSTTAALKSDIASAKDDVRREMAIACRCCQ